MIIRKLNRRESQKAMEEWKEMYPQLPIVDSDYAKIRSDLQELFKFVLGKSKDCREDKYYIDSQFGLLLYEYFNNIADFNMRVAADDDFWRYLSIIVVPDLVAYRWGKDNDSHYWSKPARIWLRSIWWFVHLSWQGNWNNTKNVLECSHFTTDTILNVEERTGRKGTYVEVYRSIIKFYSEISDENIINLKKANRNGKEELLRIVMKLNTAKMMIIDPVLYKGGITGYVRDLYKDAGVRF